MEVLLYLEVCFFFSFVTSLNVSSDSSKTPRLALSSLTVPGAGLLEVLLYLVCSFFFSFINSSNVSSVSLTAAMKSSSSELSADDPWVQFLILPSAE